MMEILEEIYKYHDTIWLKNSPISQTQQSKYKSKIKQAANPRI